MRNFKDWFLERWSYSFVDDEKPIVGPGRTGALPYYSQDDKPETLKKDPRINKKKPYRLGKTI